MLLAGKTLILKEGAIRITKQKHKGQPKETDEGAQDVGTDEEGKNRVYYISLVAADRNGVPRDEYFTFDVASKIDLEDTDVDVLDCQDLINQYRNQNEGKVPRKITVYELVENFVKNHPRANLFVDECPFLMKKNTVSYGKSI